MSLSGSSSYYMPRGMAGSGTQSGLHGSLGIRPISSPNVQFQSNLGGGNMGSALPGEPPASISPHSVNVGAPSVVPQSEPVKRKRGRPRKYGPDGSVSLALSPSPSTHGGTNTITSSQKRGRGRPPGTGRKQQLASLGKSLWLDYDSPKHYTAFFVDICFHSFNTCMLLIRKIVYFTCRIILYLPLRQTHIINYRSTDLPTALLHTSQFGVYWSKDATIYLL
jgi:hypothetical protein